MNFIYFHVLRHWDRDISVYCRQQSAAEDAWHRHGLSEALGYDPLGKGTLGIGTGFGYSDADVDELPLDTEGLGRYHQILVEETDELLAALDDQKLVEQMQLDDRTFTPGQRLRHLIAHNYLHVGDIEYAKGLLGAPAGDFPTLE